MHEQSIAHALLQQVEQQAREHRAAAVVRVHVRLGALSGVEPQLLRTAFEAMRTEVPACREAALELETVPLRWACPRCDATIDAGAPLRCPACDQPARLVTGDEIMLQRIEMERDHV